MKTEPIDWSALDRADVFIKSTRTRLDQMKADCERDLERLNFVQKKMNSWRRWRVILQRLFVAACIANLAWYLLLTLRFLTR